MKTKNQSPYSQLIGEGIPDRRVRAGGSNPSADTIAQRIKELKDKLKIKLTQRDYDYFLEILEYNTNMSFKEGVQMENERIKNIVKEKFNQIDKNGMYNHVEFNYEFDERWFDTWKKEFLQAINEVNNERSKMLLLVNDGTNDAVNIKMMKNEKEKLERREKIRQMTEENDKLIQEIKEKQKIIEKIKESERLKTNGK